MEETYLPHPRTLKWQQSKKRVGFLDLPFELRSMVYKHLTVNIASECLAVTCFAGAKGSAPEHISKPPAIPGWALGICKQIRVELLRSVVSTDLYVDLRRCYPTTIVDTFRDLLETMDDKVVSALQIMTVHVDLYPMDLVLRKGGLRRTLVGLWEAIETLVPNIQHFALKIRATNNILNLSPRVALAYPAEVRSDLKAFFASRCGDFEGRVVPSWASVLFDYEIPHHTFHEELNDDFVMPAWKKFKSDNQEQEAARQLKKRNEELARRKEIRRTALYEADHRFCRRSPIHKCVRSGSSSANV